ncbi:MAG: hypothetical protein JO041_06030 [Acidobacteria bacterium]|nr:hypothetical protein [Acidobacteriota bacterium]
MVSRRLSRLFCWVVLALFAACACLPLSAANWVVTSAADDGSAGTLRYAIANAAGGDTITFNLALPATITLAGSALPINTNLTINGPGASQLAISGNNASPVFTVSGGTTVVISGLTVENGTGQFGGGILNGGTLTVNNSVISNNSSCCGTQGGGIINGGTLTVNNSTFSGNGAYYDGGGILNQGIATVNQSTFTGNTADYGAGGAIKNGVGGSLLNIINSTFSGNGACGPYGPPTYGYLGLGGAIANGSGAYGGGGTVNIVNSTFSGNCGREGGALFNATGTMTIKNSIFANSLIEPGSASPGNCYNAGGSMVSQGFNLSDDTTCSSFFTAAGDLNNTPAGLDPKGLQNNGGPTQTIALLPTSPAVFAVPVGPTNYCTDTAANPVILDQRSISRPQGAACDMGAYELVFSADNDSGLASLTGGNTLTGNQTVNGAISATSFAGNGAGITGVIAAGLNCAGCIGNGQINFNYALGDAQGGNAVNALMFGNQLPSFYAPAVGSVSYVAKSGDTMSGALYLPSLGTTQIAAPHGNPANTLNIVGDIGINGVIPGGSINISAGYGTGNGGDVNITAGPGGQCSNCGYSRGGNIILTPGDFGHSPGDTGTPGVIQLAGPVGVGTNAPDANLTVETNIPQNPKGGWTAQLHLDNSDASNGTFISLTAGSGANDPWGLYRYGSNGGTNGITANPVGSTANRFCIGVLGVNEPLCVSPQGTVGISTAFGPRPYPPALEVTGDVSVSGGTVTAGAFSGNGAGLTNVTAASAASLTGSINDTQVTNLNTDLAGATASAVATSEAFANSNFLPLAGGTVNGSLSANSLNVAGGTLGVTNGTLSATGNGVNSSTSVIVPSEYIGATPAPCATPITDPSGAPFGQPGDCYTMPVMNVVHDTNNGASQPTVALAVNEDAVNGRAMFAHTTATQQPADGSGSIAIIGLADDPGGAGVVGIGSSTANGADALGVQGITNSDFGTGVNATSFGSNAFGLRANAWGTSGVGLMARAFGSQAVTSEFFNPNPNGLLIAGFRTINFNSPTNQVFSLDASGNLNASGAVTAASFTGSGAGLTNVMAASAANLTGSINDTQVNNLTTDLANASASALSASESYANAKFLPLTGGAMTGALTVGTGDVAVSSGNLDLPQTSGSTLGVLNLGGGPFLHAYGSQNVFIGAGSGNFNMSGFRNTAVGSASFPSNSSGSNNTAVGFWSLLGNTSGGSNAAAGMSSLKANTTGSANAAFGLNALLWNTSGNNNTALGAGAGSTNSNANANVTGSGNTFVGVNSGPGTSTQLNNATAIGALATVGESNALVLGSINGVNGATSSVNVGIGTATPAYMLDVAGTIHSSGTVAAASFTGNGAGLTNVAATSATTASALNCAGCIGNSQLGVNYAGSASQGGPATSALAANLAANSSALGNVAAANYARLDIGNSFPGNQAVTGNISATGALSVTGATSTGTVAIGGGTPIKEHLSITVNPAFPALKPGQCTTAGFTFTGASDGDTTALGVPNSRMTGGPLIYTAWVSAANIMTVQVCYAGNAPQKTANTGAIRIDLWKH